MITIFFVQVVVLATQQWRSRHRRPGRPARIPRPDSVPRHGVPLQDPRSTSCFLVFMIVSLLILWAIENSRVGHDASAGIKQADSLSRRAWASTPWATRWQAFAPAASLPVSSAAFYAQYVSAVDPSCSGSCSTIYILIYVIVGGEGVHRARHRRLVPHRASRGGPAAQVVDAGAFRGDPHSSSSSSCRKGWGLPRGWGSTREHNRRLFHRNGPEGAEAGPDAAG